MNLDVKNDFDILIDIVTKFYSSLLNVLLMNYVFL